MVVKARCPEACPERPLAGTMRGSRHCMSLRYHARPVFDPTVLSIRTALHRADSHLQDPRC